jgi:hypothetical protein
MTANASELFLLVLADKFVYQQAPPFIASVTTSTTSGLPNLFKLL